MSASRTTIMKPPHRATNPLLLVPGFCFCARLLLATGFIAVTGILQFVRAAPPPFEWANLAGTVNDDYGRAMAADAAGNSYFTGSIDGTATFGSTKITSSGGSNRPDIFVALIENGDTVWVKRAGTVGGNASGDFGAGIGLDASGNIYLGGTLGVNDPGSLAVFDSITPSMYGRRDIFVAKMAGTAPANGPAISFSLAGTTLNVTWPLANADFNIESSASLGSGFGPATEPRVTNSAPQTISVTILPLGTQKFYRLARP